MRKVTISGYEDLYCITIDGRVYSNRSKKFLSQGLDTDGYRHVVLCNNNKRKVIRTHLLVCMAFHGPRPKNLTASHLDDNKLNNHANNLCWESRKDNIARSQTRITEAVREYYKAHDGPWHGKTRDPEFGKKISKALKGRTPWNKGMKFNASCK